MTITETKPTKVICLQPPADVAVEFKLFEWVAAVHKGRIVMGLTGEDYDKLSENTSLLLKIIKDKNAIGAHWKNCVIDHNERVENDD